MQFPEGFKAKYQTLLGDEAPAFFASFDEPIHHGFRINPLKGGLPTGLSSAKPIEHVQFGYYGQIAGHTVAHQSGQIYSQEPSAMRVGQVAAPKPGQKVLDLCAAPGGKTTHLESFMDDEGLLVSNEIFAKRAKILAENVERFGSTNTMVTNEAPASLAPHFPHYFDVIVVDAPCSGEGMFRKDPDAMGYWTPDYPKECATRQREILTEAMKMLAPNGRLIYSTCTFAPEENEQMIAWLLDNYPTLSITPINKHDGMSDGRPEWADGNSELTKTTRLFPHQVAGEGHFIASLQKNAPDEAPVATPSKKKKRQEKLPVPDKDQLAIFRDFEDEVLTTNLPEDRLMLFGDHLYLLPEIQVPVNGLKLTMPGRELGVFKKNRFEPAYGFALSLAPEAVKTPVTISTEQWMLLMHGDTFQTEADVKGWHLLTCNGQAVAFAKIVNHTVKNFVPKGLRFNPPTTVNY